MKETNDQTLEELDATTAYLKGFENGKKYMLYQHAWIPSAGCLPDSNRKVLCLTRTKKGVLNYVIGYWDERWCCGMNSNVIAWMELPAPPDELS